ncbi:hypothetical protein [Pseudoduganella lutea]|uniref:Uncharacterized protein n=1 Tax=Pseudoduganella lutea TaxID=321985 RepID=A0A4P6L2X1_9BURK|nr:hypothetical protein [Pseudoduganella lutea]QBE65910.1 hypothetical protein EWM63_25415 [Pseudoduganella lutea]
MFNSETLEVAIGMAFLFLMMSLVCTGIREYIEGFLKWRAMDLERAVRTLLDDRDGQVAAYFYGHPLISSLYQGSYDPAVLATTGKWESRWKILRALLRRDAPPDAAARNMPRAGRRHLPSYIPSELFAKALIDIVGRGPAGVDAEHTASDAVTVELLRERAAAIGSPILRRVVLSAIDYSKGDLNQLQLDLQRWFDGSMDRAAGWYKRRTQAILFGLGLAAAVSLNVDALYVMERLTNDKALRSAVVTAAGRLPESVDRMMPTAGTGAPAVLALDAPALQAAEKARDLLREIGMPMGWVHLGGMGFFEGMRPVQLCKSVRASACTGSREHPSYARIAAGWLITAIGVMLGAPFWFDVLNRFMVIRSTVKPHEKSPEEGSEDRKGARPPPPAQSLSPVQAEPPAPAMTGPTGGGGARALAAPPPEAADFVPHAWRDGVVNEKEIPL